MNRPHSYINQGVYVLHLEGDRFYVGESEDIDSRVSNHNSAWTDKYEPIGVDDIFPAKCRRKSLEREVTLLYMNRYGWENVRGAGWTKVNMRRPPRELRN